MKAEAETGGTRPRAQGRLESQKLEEAGRTLLWSLRREHSPAWISAVLPLLDLSSPAPPGSQWSFPRGSQWSCPTRIRIPALPGCQTSSLQSWESMNSCGFMHPGYGNLLWMPQELTPWVLVKMERL